MAKIVKTGNRVDIIVNSEYGCTEGLFVEETTFVGSDTPALRMGDFTRMPMREDEFQEQRTVTRAFSVETAKDLVTVLQAWIVELEKNYVFIGTEKK